MTDLARQYALAVFSLAKKNQKSLELQKNMENFILGINEEIYKFFAHPKISKQAKKDLLEKVVKDKLLQNFLKVLVDNDRISLIEDISFQYKAILDEIDKVMDVVVKTNKPLTKTNLEKIKNKLKTTYDKKIHIEEIIDQTIIGGVRLEFEDKIIDETINKQLEDIESSLSE